MSGSTMHGAVSLRRSERQALQWPPPHWYLARQAVCAVLGAEHPLQGSVPQWTKALEYWDTMIQCGAHQSVSYVEASDFDTPASPGILAALGPHSRDVLFETLLRVLEEAVLRGEPEGVADRWILLRDFGGESRRRTAERRLIRPLIRQADAGMDELLAQQAKVKWHTRKRLAALDEEYTDRVRPRLLAVRHIGGPRHPMAREVRDKTAGFLCRIARDLYDAGDNQRARFNMQRCWRLVEGTTTQQQYRRDYVSLMGIQSNKSMHTLCVPWYWEDVWEFIAGAIQFVINMVVGVLLLVLFTMCERWTYG